MQIAFIHGVRAANGAWSARTVHGLRICGGIGFVIGKTEIELNWFEGSNNFFGEAGMALLLQAAFLFVGDTGLTVACGRKA